MDCCVRLFCVYVVLCVGSGLATGWSPVQGVLLSTYRIKKLKKSDQVPKGCRAIQRERIEEKERLWTSISLNSVASHVLRCIPCNYAISSPAINGSKLPIRTLWVTAVQWVSSDVRFILEHEEGSIIRSTE
jgi:hypothetical protein